MNKTLRKAVMKRSHLCNGFLKNETKENKRFYKTRQNYCINLLIKTNKHFFADLNIKDICDNRKF